MEIHGFITANRIWKVRLVDVGILTKLLIESYTLNGVLMRGAHIKKDLRLLGYQHYSNLEFEVVAGVKGDSLDRYLIRMNECLESIKAIQQCIKALISGGLQIRKFGDLCLYMEALINYFKFVSQGYTLPKWKTFLRQESAKGELGLLIVSDYTNKPYRVKIRSPD